MQQYGRHYRDRWRYHLQRNPTKYDVRRGRLDYAGKWNSGRSGERANLVRNFHGDLMKLLILLFILSIQADAAYSFRRTITLNANSAFLPSTQTNFPLMVKLDSSNAGTTMKAAGSGGHIQNAACTQASGPAVTMPCDLIFTSDAGGSTKIPWEVENYDSTGGTLWAHLLCASCAQSAVLYMFYGDAAVSTPQNTGSFTPSLVWTPASFITVQHETDFNALTDSADSNNAIRVSTTNTTGQIDGGNLFVFTSAQFQDYGQSLSLAPNIVRFSAWVNGASFPQNYNAVVSRYVNGVVGGYELMVRSTGKIALYTADTAGNDIHYDSTGIATLSPSTWYHLAFTCAAGTITGYVNGVLDQTVTFGTLGFASTQPNNTYVGISVFNNRQWDGVIDEVKWGSALPAVPADWFTAEYNNGLVPQTFSILGAETANVASITRHKVIAGQ